MMPASVLHAVLPRRLPPIPSLDTLLHSYHVPTKPGHTDRLPFSLQNQVGGARVCMPTVVSYLQSNAFRAKENGAPGEGQVFNTHTDEWEEPDVSEKERFLGFQVGDTAAPGVTADARAIRIRRALDAHTMRWLGAFLHASQE